MADSESLDAGVLRHVLKQPGDDVEPSEHEDCDEVIVGDHVFGAFLNRGDVHEGSDRHVQDIHDALDDERPCQA